MKFEYSTVEWLWDSGSIRINGPRKQEARLKGSYAELVDTLNQMGEEGWEVVGSTSQGNWIFWTLKRDVTPGQSPQG
jgi:hypothetical protein